MLELAISVVVFLGLPAGMYIASQAKEEMKTGRKFFLLLEKILLFVILTLLMHAYSVPLVYRLGSYVVLGIILLGRPPPATTYTLLGIGLVAATITDQIFAWIAALMFLYGLVNGSLAYISFKQVSYPLLIATRIGFLVTSFLLILWKPF